MAGDSTLNTTDMEMGRPEPISPFNLDSLNGKLLLRGWMWHRAATCYQLSIDVTETLTFLITQALLLSVVTCFSDSPHAEETSMEPPSIDLYQTRLLYLNQPPQARMPLSRL